MDKIKQIKYPCRNCIYFNECGDTQRTEHCGGRKTKRDKNKEVAKA